MASNTKQTFDLSAIPVTEDWYDTRAHVQSAIDGVNSALSDYPDAWDFVARNGLRMANRDLGEGITVNPIAAIVFRAMEKDGHSGGSASLAIAWISKLARERFYGPAS